jgi:hypothetical protein
MDIVRDNKPISTVGSLLTSNVALKVVLGLLNQVRVVQEIVLGIEIEVDNVVTKRLQIGLAVGVAAGKRRAHVGRENTEDVVQSNLVVVHLVLPLSGGDRSKILVAPRVGRDLMPSSIHTLDDCRVTLRISMPLRG